MIAGWWRGGGGGGGCEIEPRSSAVFSAQETGKTP